MKELELKEDSPEKQEVRKREIELHEIKTGSVPPLKDAAGNDVKDAAGNTITRRQDQLIRLNNGAITLNRRLQTPL